MEKSGAARVKQVYYCCAVFSVTHFKQRVFLLYLLAVYFALPVKYTVYCSTAISVVVVVPQPEAQPLKKELVVVVVPQPEPQPLKVHPKTCQVYSVCVVGCAFEMAVLVYQISKTKTKI